MLAGVTRAAVTQWRKRHADFPAPVNGHSDRFDLNDIIGWLDSRPVPATSRAADEPVGATYGNRARRRARPADRPDADSTFRALMALEPQVCGGAPHGDYLYLLLCLAFLNVYDHDRWVQLTRSVPVSGDPGDARRFLRRVVAAVDGSLDFPELPGRPDAPPVRLRPLAFEPVRQITKLASGLLPADFEKIRAAVIQEVGARNGEFYTPASVTRLLVDLLSDHTVQGDVKVHDPFARFGELSAEFARRRTDQTTVQVHIEHPHPSFLRMAGMWLAATDSPAELNTMSSPPAGGATYVMANPPFGQRRELTEWLPRCIDLLSEDGRAGVVMPYSAGFDPGARARDTRRELVENGAVLSVTALPARMFTGTSVGVCLWLLRRPTGHAAPVKLVDARHLGRLSDTSSPHVHVFNPGDITTIAETATASEPRPGFSVLATPDEIRAHGYCLHPPEYQDRALAPMGASAACAELDTLFEDLGSPSYSAGQDPGWPRCRLRDVCGIRAGVSPGSLKRAISEADTARETVPVVHPKHLDHGHIKADDADDADDAATDALDRYRLQTGDVLLVRTGAMGKTAIVRRGESGWLPHPNLLRLRVTKTADLDPDYLLAYLSQETVQARIRARSVQSVTTSLSADTLGDLEMPLPPLAGQRRILSSLQVLDEQTAALEQRLTAARAARAAFARHVTDGTVILTEGDTRE